MTNPTSTVCYAPSNFIYYFSKLYMKLEFLQEIEEKGISKEVI